MRATADDKGNLVWQDDYNRIANPIRNYYRGLNNFNPLKGHVAILDLDKPNVS
ncbi:hypothetical protein D3C86_1860680 [compost metagenome]